MNIIEAEDMVKGLPDQVLFQEAQYPSGRIPQYLAVSEVQRRQEMRQRFQAQQAAQQQPTVKDQILQGGIAAAGGPPPGAGQPPPMAPPGGAPPMAPPMGAGQPPVMAAAGGMMPYSMAGGRSVPAGTGRFFGGFGPEILNTPDRLQRNYGSVNPGVDNYAALGRGMNLIDAMKFIKNPNAEQYSDALAAAISQKEAMKASLNRGITAPPGGAVGGGGGGGLPYGGPTSYAGRDALRDLIDQVNMQQGKPTVTVEEIPTGMAVGGIVPPVVGRISDLAPETSSQPSQSSMPSIGPPRETIIRRAKALIEQGREMDALVLLRQAGISPQEVMNMATGGLTPGGIVHMVEGKTVPNDPGATMFTNMMGRVPEAFKVLRGLMPPPAGISEADISSLRPTREQYFDPQAEARRAALLTQLEQMGTSRKAEDIAAAERYLKEAEAPIQAAQDEARQAAIASTLMRLGAGIAAGKGAEGLASAAQGVEQTMGRAREVAAAERRAARQDYRTAEREAIRGQRAMADQAFLMQAQNITNDENKQQQFVRDQNQFAQFLYTERRKDKSDQRTAYNDALKLSIGLAQTIDEALRTAGVEKQRNERQYAQNVISIYDNVSDRIKNITEMIDKRQTIGGKTNPNYGKVIVDENGDPVPPTADYLAEEAVRLTNKAINEFGIGNPNKVAPVVRAEGGTVPAGVSLEINGETYRFPNQEAVDKFKAAAGIK